jgi:hypothetical protein
MGIDEVADLGGGLMGSGIAESTAVAGLSVIVRDIDDTAIGGARSRIEMSLGAAVRRGKVDQAAAAEILNRISYTTELDDIEGADLVVEAVPENAELKANILAQVAGIVSEDALIASNTSSIPIAQLAAGLPRPERVLGLHFFSPVPVMALVEIVVALDTSEQTRRMHPDVCRFISEAFYEGRLHSIDECSERTTSDGVGVRWLDVVHEGNRVDSEEEADAIAAEIERLLGHTFTEAGVERPLEPDDFMVVAPFNAQVRLLHDRLPGGVEVGTVDKFQGRQAAVVFYSMASSSGEDVPRGLDFLLSRNRLNVAVSRAQCLAYVACSPRLLEVDCRTVEHLKLANALCRFVEIAAARAKPELDPNEAE